MEKLAKVVRHRRALLLLEMHLDVFGIHEDLSFFAWWLVSGRTDIGLVVARERRLGRLGGCLSTHRLVGFLLI